MHSWLVINLDMYNVLCTFQYFKIKNNAFIYPYLSVPCLLEILYNIMCPN